MILALALVSILLAKLDILANSGISPLILAIFLGAALGNLARPCAKMIADSGVLGICAKQILRLGVILYGFRVTFGDVADIGVYGVGAAFVVVFGTFGLGYFAGVRLGLDKKLAILISSGAAICGAAAVMAVQSVVKSDSNRVAVAVGTVVIFGTLGMICYPFIASLAGFSSTQGGMFSGASLHEVAHVVAASNAIGENAPQIAITVKMIRVLMLAPFLIFLSIFSSALVGEKQKANVRANFPYFALWFVVAMAVGSAPFFPRETLIAPIEFADNFLLCAAMGALGLTITKKAFSNAGKIPFILASILFVWLICIGLTFGAFA